MPRLHVYRRPLQGLLVASLVLSFILAPFMHARGASPLLGAPALLSNAATESAPHAAPAASLQQLNGPDPALTNVAKIDSASEHTCILLTSGAVQCFGNGNLLGREITDSSNRPVNIEGAPTRFTQISAGFVHTCGVTIAKTVKCWGNGSSGYLGNGSLDPVTSPVNVVGLSDVKSVSVGSEFTCALANSGDVWCWGRNVQGAIFPGSDRTTPLQIAGLAGVKAISAGTENVCVISSANQVLCWGAGANGVLGASIGSQTTPQAVPGTAGATAIGVGAGFACAISSGSAICWGHNGFGQLGTGDVSPINPTPAGVVGLSSGVTDISLGSDHACAVASGTLYCWGTNFEGELGNGTNTDSNVPVAVAGMNSGVVSVGLGAHTSCAVLQDGTARCWGRDDADQVGMGDNHHSSPPVQVTGLLTPTGVTAGYAHACAQVNGGAKCWGAGDKGQLGNGVESDSIQPVDVSGLVSTATSLDAGDEHTCALDGTLTKCWGNGGSGRLGNGSTSSSSIPVAVPVNPFPVSVSAGAFHTCFSDGFNALCWGFGGGGRLGNGGTSNSSSPVGVTGLVSGPSIGGITAGGDHSCALIEADDPPDDYAVSCWGSNVGGQLGNGSIAESSVPVEVSNLQANVTHVSAGIGFTCAIENGAAKCWGSGPAGQLGNGVDTGSLVPVLVTGMGSGVASISGGDAHGCAVVSGAVKCWGDNYYSQLGNNAVANSLIPMQVPALATGATLVSAGGTHSCALVAGTVWCWGANDRGQIGVPKQSVPQVVVAGDDAPQLVTLTTVVNGSGLVTSLPAGINCGSDCTEVYLQGAEVTLLSQSLAGAFFIDWSGECNELSPGCTFSMFIDKTVTINFSIPLYELNVGVVGSGKVTTVPAGIDCGVLCSVEGVSGTIYHLTAAPGVGYHLAEWTGDCAGSGLVCTLTLTEDTSSTAVFEINAYALNVAVNGGGTVSGAFSQINCGPTCSTSISHGQNIQLIATPNANHLFTGWSGSCTSTSPTCAVSMTSAKQVTANFAPVQHTLTVTVVGGGTVTSAPAGINCSVDCTQPYAHGTTVTLTATPGPGKIFHAWSEGCLGVGNGPICSRLMDRPYPVTAIFTDDPTDPDDPGDPDGAMTWTFLPAVQR